jgi:hypothetical protein
LHTGHGNLPAARMSLHVKDALQVGHILVLLNTMLLTGAVRREYMPNSREPTQLRSSPASRAEAAQRPKIRFNFWLYFWTLKPAIVAFLQHLPCSLKCLNSLQSLESRPNEMRVN